MIAIIDYVAGNIKSVEKALAYLGEEACITRDSDLILQSDKVILPGVGNFGDAMKNIRKYHLENVIYDVVDHKTPFLGICLGLQLLYKTSDECPDATGLGLLDGTITKIPPCKDLKIPHMGWNSLQITENATLFKGIPQESFVYFVHSYYLTAARMEDVAASTFYSTNIHASVEHDNIYACQFHPEKSGTVGLQILKNFLEIKEA